MTPASLAASAVEAKTIAPVAIDIRKLSLIFSTGDTPVHALADIDLAVNRGEFVSFIAA